MINRFIQTKNESQCRKGPLGLVVAILALYKPPPPSMSCGCVSNPFYYLLRVATAPKTLVLVRDPEAQHQARNYEIARWQD